MHIHEASLRSFVLSKSGMQNGHATVNFVSNHVDADVRVGSTDYVVQCESPLSCEVFVDGTHVRAGHLQLIARCLGKNFLITSD